MVSVGVVAAIVNLAVLTLVVIFDRLIGLVLRNFVAAHLRKHATSPVVHDSDTWLPYIFHSIFKYRKNPAVLLTLTCAVFLVGSEIVTELGVSVSDTCTPVKKRASVIGLEDDNIPVEISLSASSLSIQNTNFLDGNLTRLPTGLPRKITGKECLRCMTRDEYPDIISSCEVSEFRRYEAGELSVSLQEADPVYKTVTKEFVEIATSKSFSGRGDFTSNGDRMSSFVFAATSESDVLYFEYSNQDHLSMIMGETASNKPDNVTEATRSTVYAQRISCDNNRLGEQEFLSAIFSYHVSQLENYVTPAVWDGSQERFQRLTENDVYRAVLSLKIISSKRQEEGEFYEYTSCGTYNWVYGVALAVCVCVVTVLFAVSWTCGPREVMKEFPYSSRSWFATARGEATDEEDGLWRKARAGYDDEMVLLNESQGGEVHLGLRSRHGQVISLSSFTLNDTPKDSMESYIGIDFDGDSS